VSIEPFGDGALLVTLGDHIDLVLNRRVHRLAQLVMADAEESHSSGRPAWGTPVPAYASLLVPYDVETLDVEEAKRRLAEIAAHLTEERASDREAAAVEEPPIEIPVRYGGADGPDLEWVAAERGLTRADVVRLHTGTVYTAFMLGFVPGFAYLGTLPPALVTPRHSSPRVRVPAGSVGIAGEQTAIYPSATPGGWQLIGRTEVRVWDVNRDRPALLGPGARVRFVPIDR
jgi:inhibitor of KinA